MIKRIKNGYYWVIVIVLFVELGIFGGILNTITSIFIKPVSEGLQISRGTYSLAFSVEGLMALLSVMLTPKLIERFTFRKCASGHLLLAAAAFFLYSQMKSLGTFIIASVMLGMCVGISGIAGATYVVDKWFHKHHGLMLGIVVMSTGLGGSAISIVLSAVIETYGWRTGFAILAGLMVVLAALLFFLVYDRPEHIGMVPYGDYTGKNREYKKEDMGWPGYTEKELFRLPAFYGALLAILLSNLGLYFTYFFVLPFLQDQGFSVQTAAKMQSVMFIWFAVFKMLSGEACDRIGAKRVTILCLGAGAVSQWMLAGAATAEAATVWLVVYSAALPITAVTIPPLVRSLFGYMGHDMSSSMGLAMVQVACLIAQPLAGFIYDRLGSYGPGFRMGAVLDVSSIAMLIFLYITVKKVAAASEKWN